MFKQIFRITFVTFVWKQYKRLIISTLLLFAFLWLVGSIHDDYLNYVATQNDDRLAGQSYIIKWAALVGGVMLYMAYHWSRSVRAKSGKDKEQKGKLKNMPEINSFSDDPEGAEDPFQALRTKKKLRSRAEIMTEKENRSP